MKKVIGTVISVLLFLSFSIKVPAVSISYIVAEEEKTSIIQLLNSYFTKRYNSFTTLNSQTYNEFFYSNEDALKSCKLNTLIMNTIVEYRNDDRNHNYLRNYDFKLYITDIKKDKNIYTLNLNEKYVYRYNGLEVDSEGITKHTFILKETSKGFKIIQHENEDVFIKEMKDLYSSSISEYSDDDKENSPFVLNSKKKYNIDIIKENILNTARMERQSLISNTQNYIDSKKFDINFLNKTNGLSWINYDRTAAYNYAAKWARGFNPSYPNFEKSEYGGGGDCTNFTSQCILAGGIPMDLTGTYKWKYYGTKVDESSNKVGRTPSWTGVKEFKRYAINNSGQGLNATVSTGIRNGERGDIIQIGEYHGTVVTNQVIRSGRVVDLLIACHTSPRFNESVLNAWPSAEKTLIKVNGGYK